MSSEWTTVTSKKRGNMSRTSSHSGSERAYVPRHMRGARRTHKPRQRPRQPIKVISPKVKLLLSEDAFPVLGAIGVQTKPTWINNSIKQEIIKQELPKVNIKSNLPRLVIGQVVARPLEDISKFPLIRFPPKLCKPRIEYSSEDDEYSIIVDTEYIPETESQYLEERAKDQEESQRPIENEENFIFLNIDCCECNSDDLELEHIHQMCPIGFQIHDPNNEFHKQCYICSSCLLQLYNEYEDNLSQFYYRTCCGHQVSAKQLKDLVENILVNNTINQSSFDIEI